MDVVFALAAIACCVWSRARRCPPGSESVKLLGRHARRGSHLPLARCTSTILYRTWCTERGAILSLNCVLAHVPSKLLPLGSRLLRRLAGLSLGLLCLSRLLRLLLCLLRLFPLSAPGSTAPVTPHPWRWAVMPVRLRPTLRTTLRSALHGCPCSPTRHHDHARDEEEQGACSQQQEEEAAKARPVWPVTDGIGNGVGSGIRDNRRSGTLRPCGGRQPSHGIALHPGITLPGRNAG